MTSEELIDEGYRVHRIRGAPVVRLEALALAKIHDVLERILAHMEMEYEKRRLRDE
jgi:hypothetical protein